MEKSRIYEAMEIAGLIVRSRNAALTDSEQAKLSAWINEDPRNASLYAQFQRDINVHQLLKQMDGYDFAKSLAKVRHRITGKRIMSKNISKLVSVSRIRWMAAAVVILALGMGTWFMLNDQRVSSSLNHTTVSTYKNDVEPGRTGSILHFPDGSTVNLDTLQSNSLNTSIGFITKNEQFASFQKKDPGNSIAGHLVLETPRSRTQSFKLPDGTIAWLNSSSTIRFPTTFSHNVREVEITGEVYFEVAHDALKPFRVKASEETVEVLGTHFNINAYPYKQHQVTTLLEGSVKVSGVILEPSQQFSAGKISSADTSLVIAWKNGYFQFGHHTVFREVIAQLENWYDIEVEYEGMIPERTFYGKIPRHLSLVNTLTILEELDVHFRLEGKKLTILR